MVNTAQTSRGHWTTNVLALRAATLAITVNVHEAEENAMPQFGSPFSELANARKLTDEELVRAIRFMVAAEYEATQMYMQLAESSDNQLVVAVLKDIADEELVHAGEFLRLLYELAPAEKALYAKGAGEVDEISEKQLQ
jgi:rubrerythrin